MSTIASGEDEVLPLGMLADKQVRVGGVRAPAQRAIEQRPILETRQIRCDGLTNRDLARIRIRIRGMLRVRAWYRYEFGFQRTVWLVHLVAREARELVAYFDHAVSC